MHSSYLMLHYFVWQQNQRGNPKNKINDIKSTDKKVRFIDYDDIYPGTREYNHNENDNINVLKKNIYKPNTNPQHKHKSPTQTITNN